MGMQPAGAQAGPSLSDLAEAMCRAEGPSRALVAAADEVSWHLPSLAFVGLAVAAQDRHSVRYTTLLSAQQGAARLGTVPGPSCAAGLAMDTKQPVHVRDLANGDLGLQDLQYLQQEHDARSCLLVPLVIAQNCLASLSLAATQPDAFRGHEPWLHVVAAMCAPYVLLLNSHDGLLALEGFVSQVLPMRVALQLQDQQRRSSFMMPAGPVQQQQLLLPGGIAATGAAAGPSSTAAAAGAPAGNSGAGVPEAQADAYRDTAAPAGGRVAGSSLRQLRAVQRQRQRQQAHALQEPAQATLPAQAQQPSSLPPQQQQQHLAAWGCGWASVFQQPRLEQAYQRWALQQWLRLLDTVFLLLVLISVAGPQLQKVVSTLAGLQHWTQLQLLDAQLHTRLAALLALTVCCVIFNLQWQPADSYIHRRKPALAAVRVLRTLLLCCEFTHLSSTSAAFGTQGAGSGEQGAQGGSVGAVVGRGPSVAAAAACGLLMMLGLLGQLPARLHAAVQAVCLAFVAIILLSLNVLSTCAGMGSVGSWASDVVLRGRERGVAAAWFDGACLVALGWVLPVAVVAVVERMSRRRFLHKLT